MALVLRSILLLIQYNRFWISGPRGMHLKGPKSGLAHSASRYYAQTDAIQLEFYRKHLELCRKLGPPARLDVDVTFSD